MRWDAPPSSSGPRDTGRVPGRSRVWITNDDDDVTWYGARDDVDEHARSSARQRTRTRRASGAEVVVVVTVTVVVVTVVVQWTPRGRRRRAGAAQL